MRRQGTRQPARTMLEQLIRERQQTFEEFAEYAERFARDCGEPGTLSLRHLQRLVSGRRTPNAPLGPVRPATARLLERIFNTSIEELLAPSNLNSYVAKTHPLRVAVAVVVNNPSVLVVCRRGSESTGISWQFPAGIVKPGASSAVVAVEETYAETGVHSRVREPLGSRIHPVTNVLCDYLLCDYLGGQLANSDTVENSDVRWVGRAELVRFILPSQIFPPVLDALNLSGRV